MFPVVQLSGFLHVQPRAPLSHKCTTTASNDPQRAVRFKKNNSEGGDNLPCMALCWQSNISSTSLWYCIGAKLFKLNIVTGLHSSKHLPEFSTISHWLRVCSVFGQHVFTDWSKFLNGCHSQVHSPRAFRMMLYSCTIAFRYWMLDFKIKWFILQRERGWSKVVCRLQSTAHCTLCVPL